MAKPKLGTGARFKALKAKLAKRGDVRNPTALAAAIGRKKYGAAKMAKMAAAGRRSGHSPYRFDDMALGETPPRQEYHALPEVGNDPQPRAVGLPAGLRVAAGTENLRAAPATYDAGRVRAAPTGGADRRPAAVTSYQDGVV